MKTYIADIIPKIHKYSEKLDNLTLLTNQHWISIDNLPSEKTTYIFRTNNELLISTNGRVEKAKWEYLGNKSLLIDKSAETLLFKHGFFDENILALKVDSSNEFAVFVNENKYDGELNSIDRVINFLKEKYLDPALKAQLENSTGHKFVSSRFENNLINVKTNTINFEQQPDDKDEEIAKWMAIIITAVAVIAFLIINN